MTRLLTVAAALLLAGTFTMIPGSAAQETAGPSVQPPAAPAAPTPVPPPARTPQQTSPPPAATPAPAPDQPPAPAEAPPPPAAQDDSFERSDSNVFRLGQDFTLPAGERAQQVVVIFGNATIAGHVDQDVVVILGTARLASTATVSNNFVTIAGAAIVEQGASVDQDLVVVGGGLDAPGSFAPRGEQVVIGLMQDGLTRFVPWFSRGLLWLRPIVPELPWVWGVVAFFFLVYLAINLVFEKTVFAVSGVVRDKPLTAFGAGLLVLLLMGPVSLILAVSVIGIAVIPFLQFALIGAWILGKVSVTRALGGIIAADEADNRMLAIRAFAIGFVLLCVAYVVPVLGMVTWAITGVIGLGAAVMMFLAAYRREAPPQPSSVTVPPVPGSGTEGVPVTGPVLPGSVAYAAGVAAEAGAPPPPLPATPAGAVAQTFPFAYFRDRLAAFVLDVILVMLAVQLIDLRREGRAFFLGLLVYHIGLWTWKQTTVGGIICQLRVVRTDGARLSFADALVRGLSSIFSLVVAGIGVLWILRDPERQAWHDKIAGTYVVKVPRNYPL